ncbi:hypothetical protein J6590_009881 [Homalodisca vitripennis]|nr:hypothetical protein J6590_009881 [Homalodisca vitripennis]
MATDNTLRDVIYIPQPLTQITRCKTSSTYRSLLLRYWGSVSLKALRVTQLATDNTLRDVIDIPQPLTQVLGLREFESLASHADGHG